MINYLNNISLRLVSVVVPHFGFVGDGNDTKEKETKKWLS